MATYIVFVCLEFRKFLKACNYIDGKKIATDGTKIKAYASHDKIHSIFQYSKQLDNIEAELECYLKKLQRNDISDDIEQYLEDLSTAYNIQVSADSKYKMITTAEVTTYGHDFHCLQENHEKLKK